MNNSAATDIRTDYQRIQKAIEYLQLNFKRQPSLDEVAAHVHLSSFHFQRMFSEWAGVSPKKFLQYLSIGYAKNKIKSSDDSLSHIAFDTGLSGTGRLHDLFVKIEGMTPGEYKNGGLGIDVNYSYQESPFGPLLIASTLKGICYMAFADDPGFVFHEMQQYLPNANYHQATDAIQENALLFFRKDWSSLKEIKLHLKGTSFQLRIWQILLSIPSGALLSYSSLAKAASIPGAGRAAGSAVADNPIAFLIPCHRIIRATGEFGQYHWSPARKCALIGWEAAALDFTE